MSLSSQEILFLRDTMVRFGERSYSFNARRARLMQNGGFDAPTWAEFVELGVSGLTLSEAHGGMGVGAAGAAAVVNALAPFLVTEPLIQVLAAGAAISVTPNTSAPAQALAHALVTGEIGILLGSDDAPGTPIPFTAEPSGERWVLHGMAHSVIGAAEAQHLLIPARTGSGRIGLFCIANEQLDEGPTSFRLLDGRRAADVNLKGLTVGAEALIADDAAPVVATAREMSLILTCADTLGCMTAALDLTCDYTKDRTQFGSPLAAFQAVQHRIADMFIESEMARSLLDASVEAFDARVEDRSKTLLATKARMGKSAQFVGGQSIQLHGGIGVTEEYVLGHYYKRIQINEILSGNRFESLEAFANPA